MIKIRNTYDKVIFEVDAKSFRDAIDVIVKQNDDMCGGFCLKQADLQGADLSNAKLQRINLRGADLQNANLWLSNLSGADLTGANLQDAILGAVNLNGANLDGVSIKKIKVSSKTKF